MHFRLYSYRANKNDLNEQKLSALFLKYFFCFKRKNCLSEKMNYCVGAAAVGGRVRMMPLLVAPASQHRVFIIQFKDSLFFILKFDLSFNMLFGQYSCVNLTINILFCLLKIYTYSYSYSSILCVQFNLKSLSRIPTA
jgi:hypothetical protein